MTAVNGPTGAGAVYSPKELKHIANVDNKFNISFVQNHTVPTDLSTPEGRAAARVGNFANQFMNTLLEGDGALNWTV